MTRFGFPRRRLRSNERGAVIIELAMVAPVLSLMIVGVVDLSQGFSRKLALEQGAQRAIEKIMQTTYDDTVEGTLTKEVYCQVNGVASDGTCPTGTTTVTVTYRVEWTNSAGAVTSYSNTDPTLVDTQTKPTGTVSEAHFISVKVDDKYVPMFPMTFPSIDADGTYHVSATAGMRQS